MKKIIVNIKSTMIGLVIGALGAAVMMLSGCGAQEESTGTEARIIEEIDGQGNVISGAEKDYLGDMSKAELKALASEALTLAGKNSALPDDKMLTFGVNFDIPEGFAADVEHNDLYVTDRYPIEASCIYYTELDPDYTLQLVEEADFVTLVETAFASEKQNVDVAITEFKPITIDGIPSLRVKAEYDMDDIHMTHLMYAINGSKTYVVIYTQTDEYDRTELFEESAASIRVRK